MSIRMSIRLIPALLATCLSACGGAAPTPPPPPPPADVFHDVFLRGPASPPGTPGRVALTFDAVTPCTAALLGRLREPGPDAAPLRATFFLERRALERVAGEDPEGLRAVLQRIVAEGHAIGLRVEALPGDWRDDTAALRNAVAAEERAVRALLAEHGAGDPGPLRVWRPPAELDRLSDVSRAAAAGRALVLWSRRVDAPEAALLAERFAGAVGDGDIVALPGGGAGCPAVGAVPEMAATLVAAQLHAVTVPDLLGPVLERYAPVRVVRYHGPGLPPACAEPLGLAAESDAEAATSRWGLVDADAADGALRVLPLPGTAGATGTFVGAPLAAARSLWAGRDRWRALPACLRQVPAHRVESPITARRAAGERARWWVAGPGGVAERDPRALAPPGRPVLLPTRADLLRLEARLRLPERLRGVVADALERLGLETPLLVEARATTGVVVGAPLRADVLAAAPAERRRALAGAVAGYVQLLEVSLGEYLFLAAWSPGDAAALARAARGADGVAPAGPFLTLPSVAGGAPRHEAVGTDGVPAFAEPPERLLARVLRAGVELHPGDVVAAEPPPVVGPPAPAAGARSEPAAGTSAPGVRDLLAMALVRGFANAAYLRPGHVWRAEGDLLGHQTLRIALAPGVAVPSADLRPLAEPPATPEAAPSDAASPSVKP